MASSQQTKSEAFGLPGPGPTGNPEVSLPTLTPLPIGRHLVGSGKGHEGISQSEQTLQPTLRIGRNKRPMLSNQQTSGGVNKPVQEAPNMLRTAESGNPEDGKVISISQRASISAHRVVNSRDVPDSTELDARANSNKREPLRSKRYVAPKQLDVSNLDASPSGLSPSPLSLVLKSPGPSQRTMDRTQAVLALPAPPPPAGRETEPTRQKPTPRQARKHAAAIVTVPAPQVRKPQKPQGPVHTPRFAQPINVQAPSRRPHFPVKPEVPPPPAEKKVDARTLSVKIWTLEQLLKNDNTEGGAIQSLVRSDMSLVNGTPRLKKLYAIWRIGELVRCGKVPATPEDFALLDEVLPTDEDRTRNILLDLKTEAVIQHIRVTDDRSDRNWKLFSWALRLYFTDGGVSSRGLQERRAELLAAEKSQRKQVTAKALLARYPLEGLLQQLRKVVEEAKSDEPTFLEHVFDDVTQHKYAPSVPAPLLTDAEAAAFAESDARANVRPSSDGAEFSGREPGLVDVEELERKARGGKGSKNAAANGAFVAGAVIRTIGAPPPVSRRNLAFKPEKHKLPQGPVEIVVPRPVGTPIRERWWEKQLRGPDGKFFTAAEKARTKARMENGSGNESGGEGRGKKRKVRGSERLSLLGPERNGPGLERNGMEPNESGKEWVGGPDEPGPKKKRVLEAVTEDGGAVGGLPESVEGGFADGGSAGGASEGGEKPRKTSTRERKSNVLWGDYEWWDGSASDDSERGAKEGPVDTWAVLGADDEDDDGHEGLCKVCGQPGTLLLCEGCPSVYHYRCAGLDDMPLEDKWWCPECQAAGRGGEAADYGTLYGGLEYGGGGQPPVGGGVGRPRASGEETAAAVLVMLGDGND